MKEYENLKELMTSLDVEMTKAVSGNKAAGTRARKILQDVKNTAQEIRKNVLELSK